MTRAVCVVFANVWISTYILTHAHKNANSKPYMRHVWIILINIATTFVQQWSKSITPWTHILKEWM